MSRSVLMVCVAVACICARAQEPSYGISVPITLSGNAMYTHGPAGDDYQGNSTTAGFQGVISPTMRLGEHWFFYSAFEAHSSDFYRYRSGLDTDQFVRTNLIQAFVGYTAYIGSTTLLIKAGQLSSAFGSFPVAYDDAKNPFPDPPPSYLNTLPLRPDQLPCGTGNLLWQSYGSDINFNCGGSQRQAYGLEPVTIYGLPGIEAQISSGALDARWQVTNSSPANPQSLLSGSQFFQWTAGTGYSVSGLRVGVSGFRGPYLDRIVQPFLSGESLRDFPASGIGVDAQWARGRWSVEGEWQQFYFDLPRFIVSPSERVAYGQLKAILSPRMYLAVRATSFDPGHVTDSFGIGADVFMAPQQVYEFAFGYRPNRHQLLKTGYAWANRNSWSADGGVWPAQQVNGVELQLVTTFTALSRAFQ